MGKADVGMGVSEEMKSGRLGWAGMPGAGRFVSSASQGCAGSWRELSGALGGAHVS